MHPSGGGFARRALGPIRLDEYPEYQSFATLDFQLLCPAGREEILNYPGQSQSLTPSSLIISKVHARFIAVRTPMRHVKIVPRHRVKRARAAGVPKSEAGAGISLG